MFLTLLAASSAKADTLADQQQALTAERAQLQQQLTDIENQIKQYEKELTGISSQKNTLANKVKQLKTKQAALNLEIKKATLAIDDLAKQLTSTQLKIDDSQQQISLIKVNMASIIQRLAQMDESPLWILAGSDNFSDFYDQLHNYELYSQSLIDQLSLLKQKSAELENSKNLLSDQWDQQKNFVNVISLQKTELNKSITDQNTLLTQTKGMESLYQKTLADQKKQAAAIRSRIYNLIGVSKKITFGAALEIAQWANGQTGVRPAFLLAILTQESNLGQNVGTCNRPGDPPEKGWKVIMKPERDHAPFTQITTDLGLDINVTPVSCPMKDKSGKQIGWGGAMGPAQFIPSTWMGYKDKISAVTGKTADPWDIRDAFLAAAIKLKADGGASKDGEWTAAMKYFSGGVNPAFRFYGDNVINTANQYQKDIEALAK